MHEMLILLFHFEAVYSNTWL